jgi:hypothetical protein
MRHGAEEHGGREALARTSVKYRGGLASTSDSVKYRGRGVRTRSHLCECEVPVRVAGHQEDLCSDASQSERQVASRVTGDVGGAPRVDLEREGRGIKGWEVERGG